MISDRRKWIVLSVLIISLLAVVLDNTVGATQSIAATQAVAGLLGQHQHALLSAADQAFVHAMQVTNVISIVIAFCGAALIAIWMPGRTRVPGGHQAAPAEQAQAAQPALAED